MRYREECRKLILSLTATVALLLILSASVYALSPEIRFDMLKTKLADQMKAKNYTEALKTIGELKKTGKALPDELLYFEGKVCVELGEFEKGYKALVAYVLKTCDNGKYCKQSIDLLIIAVKGIVKQEVRAEEEVEVKKEVTREERKRREKKCRQAEDDALEAKAQWDWPTCVTYSCVKKNKEIMVKAIERRDRICGY